MKKMIKFQHSIICLLIFMLLVFVLSCKKDDASDKIVPVNGKWSGTGISFTVNGALISDMKISYSGHASGSYCSFDYEATTTISSTIGITDNAFSRSSSGYTINGTFNSNTTAEIKFTWTDYESYCLANYSGNKTFTASFSSSAKSIDINETQINSEVLKNKDSDSKTYMIKRY
jgi:hypothetical protein